jgi:hypothetical protein
VKIQGYSASFFNLFSNPQSVPGGGTQSPTSPQLVTDSGKHEQSVQDTFANDLVRRLEANALRNTPTKDENGEDQQLASESVERSTNLAKSLTETADFVRSRFGNKASTAFMGIMIQSVGDGTVNEKSVGRGMLEAVKFVDRNFGFSEGDELISNLNGNLNEAVNDYFDNGQLEKIYASQPGQSFSNGQISGFAAKVHQVYGKDAAKSVTNLIEEALENSDKPLEGVREGVKNARDWLGENYGMNPQQEMALTPEESSASGLHPAASVKGLLVNASV